MLLTHFISLTGVDTYGRYMVVRFHVADVMLKITGKTCTVHPHCANVRNT